MAGRSRGAGHGAAAGHGVPRAGAARGARVGCASCAGAGAGGAAGVLRGGRGAVAGRGGRARRVRVSRSLERLLASEPGAGEESGSARSAWIRHASGVLGAPRMGGAAARTASRSARGVLADARSWPPRGREPVEVEELYDGLAERGLEYGPASRVCGRCGGGARRCSPRSRCPRQQRRELLRSACIRRCSTPRCIRAEVAGEDSAVAGEAGRGGVRLPFSLSGVELHAAGAARVAGRAARDGRRGRTRVARCRRRGGRLGRDPSTRWWSRERLRGSARCARGAATATRCSVDWSRADARTGVRTRSALGIPGRRARTPLRRPLRRSPSS